MLPKRFNTLQEGLFLDIYKTVLHAYISSSKDKTNIDINYAIDRATCIAMISVDNILDDDGFIKKTADIIKSCNDTRIDQLIDYPDIIKE
jgi:hypothetical protein